MRPIEVAALTIGSTPGGRIESAIAVTVPIATDPTMAPMRIAVMTSPRSSRARSPRWWTPEKTRPNAVSMSP